MSAAVSMITGAANAVLAHPLARLAPVHVGQVHVEQHQVGLHVLGQARRRRRPVAASTASKSSASQPFGDSAAKVFFIVYDKDRLALSHAPEHAPYRSARRKTFPRAGSSIFIATADGSFELGGRARPAAPWARRA